MRLVPEQLYGEPRSGASCEIFSAASLTDDNRTFGLLPDMKSWLPGDVLLIAPRPAVVARATSSKTGTIRDAQRKLGYAPAHAFWTHAAVYVGNGELVEANWDRHQAVNPVRRVDVSAYVPHAYLRRRTLRGLTDGKRSALARQAEARCGEDYSLISAVDIYVKAQMRHYTRLVPTFVLRRTARGLVCADIVSSSYDHVLRSPAFSERDDDIVVPATLSETPVLDDVEITWCTLPDIAD